jgi:hypothetical protein
VLARALGALLLAAKRLRPRDTAGALSKAAHLCVDGGSKVGPSAMFDTTFCHRFLVLIGEETLAPSPELVGLDYSRHAVTSSDAFYRAFPYGTSCCADRASTGFPTLCFLRVPDQPCADSVPQWEGPVFGSDSLDCPVRADFDALVDLGEFPSISRQLYIIER